MPIKYKDVDNSILVEASLTRATSYLTTNGMIHVTLCGLFATTSAVLIALAEQKDSTSSNAIYTFILPAFSFVILTVSLNISNWISEQISYLELFGRARSTDSVFLYFEEYQETINLKWSERKMFTRLIHPIFKAIKFYCTMPFRMNNIYCYYFLLYTVTPVVGVLRYLGIDALRIEVPTIIIVQLFLIGMGLRRYLIIELIRDDVKKHINDICEFTRTTYRTEEDNVDELK